MEKKTKTINWTALRHEYDEQRKNGVAFALAWCVKHANECQMSYGQFAQRLRR